MSVLQSRGVQIGGGVVATVVVVLAAYVAVNRPNLQGGTNPQETKPALRADTSKGAAGSGAVQTTQAAKSGTEAAAINTRAAEPAPLSEPPQAPATPDIASAPEAPSFDEVRRETDGMTVIAGRAAPGSKVSVLSNGLEVATAQADGSGKFATLAILPPDGAGKILSLASEDEKGAVASTEEVILAPIQSPTPQGIAAQADPEIAADQTQDQTAPEARLSSLASTKPDVAAVMTAQLETTATDDQAPSPVDTGPINSDPLQSQSNTPARDAMGQGSQGQDASGQDTPRQTIVDQDQPGQDAPDLTAPPSVPPSAPTVQTTGDPAAVPTPAPTDIQVSMLKSDADGVELMPGSGPQVTDRIALDTITYSDAGEVRLAGRAQAEGASVRVYLDNRNVGALEVDTTGRWRGDIENIQTGVYTLRVDELDAGGDVISRVETPFKREAPETLARALENLDGPIKAITVQKGATLWAIARERYGDPLLYVRVFEINRDAIRDPDLIYPGQVFDLPD